MDSQESKWKKYLVVIGIILIIGGLVYAIAHNDQSVNNNPNACVNNSFSIGDSGKCISDSQSLLNWYLYGIDEPNYMKITGTFSAGVQSAVTKAQSGASLTVNGQLDKQTWSLLCKGDDTPNWWRAAAKNAGCPGTV
ncbi:MAG TPA: peptidoglycan-binding domain-containing protein [Candidatus Saccharimonadales bacterium]|jgi:hypothetical protein